MSLDHLFKNNRLSINWLWVKQDNKYIVYSPDINVVGIAFTLRDAKFLFKRKLNRRLEELKSNFRLISWS